MSLRKSNRLQGVREESKWTPMGALQWSCLDFRRSRGPLDFIGVHWSPVAWSPMGLLTGSSLAPEKSYIVLTDSSPAPIGAGEDSNGLQWTSMESDKVW